MKFIYRNGIEMTHGGPSGCTFVGTNGTLRIGRRTIHDDTPHGLLSASQTIHKSSNICMVKVARLLEPDTFYQTIRSFGVGSETGIELPGEQEGAIRAPVDWSSHSLDSLAFGQEVAVTVLRMASIFATLANDGIYLAPRVVLESRDSAGRSTAAPRPNGKRHHRCGEEHQRLAPDRRPSPRSFIDPHPQ